MKKIVSTVLAVVALTLSATADAKMLTFDDVASANLSVVPTGYGAFTWKNFAVANAANYYYNFLGLGAYAGYRTGVTSGSFTAFNSGAKTAIVSAADTFDFEGAYFTSAWSDSNTVTVCGYSRGTLEYSKSITINTRGPVWLDAEFDDIDELRISSSRWQFAMDDFTYGPDPAPVPEPSAWLLLGAGCAGLALARKRRAL